MPVVFVAGRRIEVLSRPPSAPDRPWVVFLHEGLGSATQWRDFPVRVAAATGCGTLAYSRPGYGRSEKRPRPWPADFLNEEATVTLPALLREFRIANPVLYGHSDGGTIALLHGVAFPGAARGIIAEAAHVILEEIGRRGIARMQQRSVHGDVGARLRKHHGDHVDDTVLGWTEAWLSPELQGWDIRPVLGAITAPVLVIQGRDDEYGTLAQVDAIVEGVRAPVVSVVLDDCGHMPHREQRRTVLDEVTRFITQI